MIQEAVARFLIEFLVKLIWFTLAMTILFGFFWWDERRRRPRD